MEFASFVSSWPSLTILGLSCAELAKILCSAWSNIRKELHFDTTQWFPYVMQSSLVTRLTLLSDRKRHIDEVGQNFKAALFSETYLLPVDTLCSIPSLLHKERTRLTPESYIKKYDGIRRRLFIRIGHDGRVRISRQMLLFQD